MACSWTSRISSMVRVTRLVHQLLHGMLPDKSYFLYGTSDSVSKSIITWRAPGPVVFLVRYE